jgi:hypothetical protein
MRHRGQRRSRPVLEDEWEWWSYRSARCLVQLLPGSRKRSAHLGDRRAANPIRVASCVWVLRSRGFWKPTRPYSRKPHCCHPTSAMIRPDARAPSPLHVGVDRAGSHEGSSTMMGRAVAPPLTGYVAGGLGLRNAQLRAELKSCSLNGLNRHATAPLARSAARRF